MSQASTPRFFQRVWHSYLKTALLPIVLIELALVMTYLITNNIIRDENIQTMRTLSRDQLDTVADIQAGRIADQLDNVTHMTRQLARKTRDAYAQPFAGSVDEQQRYAVTDGVLHTTHGNDNQAALFYSNVTPMNPDKLRKAIQLSQADELMRAIVESQPLVAQAYINTQDSLNRIYPYFDTLSQYPHDLNIPDFNFFYEADKQHNPNEGPVWTDVYKDPAGQGWMTSCIEPVYLPNADKTHGPEAVVGLDVTLNSMIGQVQNLDVPWNGYGILVDRGGNIIAIADKGRQDWGLQNPQDEAADTLPDRYNLNKREDTQPLVTQMNATPEDGMTSQPMNGTPMIVSWHQIPGTQWFLLVMAKEKNIYADAMTLSSRFLRIGYLMIAVLAIFYLGFLLYLYRKSRALSREVAEPLGELSSMIRDIGQGNYYQRLPHFNLQELDETARGVVLTGQQLGQYTQALEEAKTNLETLNHELEERVQERTRELSKENETKATLIAELQQTQAQLVQSEKMASIGQLAAGVAHEINNPMAYISANIEAMGDYVNDMISLNEAYEAALPTEDSAEKSALEQYKTQIDYDFMIGDLQALISESREGTRRVKKIIEDLREFSHTGDEKWAWADLHKGIESTLNIANNELKYKATVVKEFGELPQVQCIPSQINQVVLNLLVNAAQAIETSGTVTVRTGVDNEQVFIEVADTGNGIDPAHVSQIFNPFFTTKPVGKGTGLGLAMSYNIMEKHHGRIAVSSEPGKGTTFTLWLPIRQPDADNPEH